MSAKPATFDPLDAPLWEGYDYFQSLPNVVRGVSYKYHVWVDPMHWKRHKPPKWVFDLKWKAYRYSEIDTVTKLKAVATEDRPGVYIFSVAPDSRVAGFPSYALYVGISNVNESGRSVRERLADYLPTNISNIKKRGNIHRMACMYYRVLWVHFAYVNKSSHALKKMETTLHGYLAPPVADKAYPVDMKPYKPAF